MDAHTLVHVEIPGIDPRAAARFYSDLFGWPAQYDAVYDYTTFTASPGPNGAYVVGDGGHGRAGEVLLHFSTGDLDATLDRALALGGQPTQPATEVPGIVRYATFADPVGNRIAISQDLAATSPSSVSHAMTAHPIVFFELPARDPQESARFFHALFGWPEHNDPASGYYSCSIGEVMACAFLAIDGREVIAGRPTIFVATDDVNATLARAVALGGVALVPETAIPGTGRFGRFADPSGVRIGLIALDRRC